MFPTDTFCMEAVVLVGLFVSVVGKASLRCSSGQYIGLHCKGCKVQVCLPCPRGRFSTGGVVFKCTPCADGYAAPQLGMDACDSCISVHQWSSRDRTHCEGVNLVATTASTVQEQEPLQCSPGQWSARRCRGCSEQSCFPCARGKFSPGGRVAECALCPRGKWASNLSQQHCYGCPTGKVAGDVLRHGLRLGAISSRDVGGCLLLSSTLLPTRSASALWTSSGQLTSPAFSNTAVCTAGKFWDSGRFGTGKIQCFPCASGRYQPYLFHAKMAPGWWRPDACQKCPAGKHQRHMGSRCCFANGKSDTLCLPPRAAKKLAPGKTFTMWSTTVSMASLSTTIASTAAVNRTTTPQHTTAAARIQASEPPTSRLTKLPSTTRPSSHFPKPFQPTSDAPSPAPSPQQKKSSSEALTQHSWQSAMANFSSDTVKVNSSGGENHAAQVTAQVRVVDNAPWGTAILAACATLCGLAMLVALRCRGTATHKLSQRNALNTQQSDRLHYQYARVAEVAQV